MSVNYNGYIFHGNFDDMWSFISRIRKEIKIPQKSIAENLVAHDFWDHADRYIVFGKPSLMSGFEIHGHPETSKSLAQFFLRSPISASLDGVIQKYVIGEKSDTILEYDSNYDLSAKICFFPISDNRFLIMFYGNEELRDWFANQTEVSEYSYWNGSDKPKRISAKEWEKRKNDWNNALHTGIPMSSGLEACLIGGMEAYPTNITPELLDELSDYEKRIKEVAYQKIFSEALQQPEVKESVAEGRVSVILKVSEECRKEVEEKWEEIFDEFSKILPKTADEFCEILKEREKDRF